MSSFRSRSGERWISNVLTRKKRSSRKVPSANHILQVAIGGADDADVDVERLVFAHPPHFARFEETAAP